MSGLPRGRGGSRGYGNGWAGRSFTNFGSGGRGRGNFNNTWNGGAFDNFLGGRGRGVGYGLPIRGGVGSGTRRKESSSVPEHRIPKGPKADRQEKEDASAVPQQDGRTENDQVKTNQQLIPTEPRADRLAKSRQAGANPVSEQDARLKDDWFKENQHRIPTGPKADRYADAARRGYMLLRLEQKHPRRKNRDAHPTLTYCRSRPPEEQGFLSSIPPLASPPETGVRPPPGNQPPSTAVTPSAAASVRPAGRVACSTNPTERTFRKVSAGSMSTPSASSEGDDGNLYDSNKTEEEKEKIRQEINGHNRGLLDAPWSGPNLGDAMQDIQLG